MGLAPLSGLEFQLPLVLGCCAGSSWSVWMLKGLDCLPAVALRPQVVPTANSYQALKACAGIEAGQVQQAWLVLCTMCDTAY